MHIEFGVSRQIVSRWENGVAVPRATKVKIICDEFNISPDTLLGKDDSKDNKNELDNKTNRYSNIVKAIGATILTILLLYTVFVIYKLIIVNKINSKIEDYDNWTNYYAEIETYEDAKQKSKLEIWYKDNKYKIIAENYFSDSEEKKITRIMNINEKKRTEIINGKLEEYNDDYISDVFYDGKYVLKYFPWIYDFKYNKVRICLNNLLTIKKEKENIEIKNGKKTVYLKEDWITPVSYSDADKEKITFTSYSVEQNIVKEDDFEIKEDL